MIRFNGNNPSDEFKGLNADLEKVLEKAGCGSVAINYESDTFVKFKFFARDSRQLSELEYGVNSESVYIKFIQILPNRTGLGSIVLRDIINYAQNNNLLVRAITIAEDTAHDIWRKFGFKVIPGTSNMELNPKEDSRELGDIAARAIQLEFQSIIRRMEEKRKDPFGLKKLRDKRNPFNLK